MRILKLSIATPLNEYSTEELMKAFTCKIPEGVKRNILNLGVRKRRLLNTTNSSAKFETEPRDHGFVNLCSEVCQNVIQKACLSVEDIGYLVTTYDAMPFLSPGLSQFLIPKLGLDPYTKSVNAQGIASTAFIRALDLAGDHLAAHPADNVLLCVSGLSSFWFQNQVRGMRDVMEIKQIGMLKSEEKRKSELRKWVATMESFLFGDGVAAAIVTNGEGELAVDRIAEVTNIGKNDYLAGYAKLSMLDEPFRFGFNSHLDKGIPKLGVKYTDLALKKLLKEDTDNTIQAAKKWTIHTGSKKILEAIAEHHGIDHEKLRESHEVLEQHGNLSGASLPFILNRIILESKLSEGDIVLMVGYGWGFSASACMLKRTR